MKSILLLIFLSLTTPLFAHEGHDHDGPARVRAPKGGQIKSLEDIHVEVVSLQTDLKIYIYDKKLKALPVESYSVKAKAIFPRTKKEEEISLKTEGTFLQATFDAKGTHRYTLVLTVRDPQHGHNDKLNYTIESH